MAKSDVLAVLCNAIRGAKRNWQTAHIAELPTIDTVLKTACFAAFFKVVEEEEYDGLLAIHEAAQSDISAVCGSPSWPRDLELVLLTIGDTTPDPAAVRRVMDDRYICRKFVLNVNGGKIRDALINLPFWPADDLLAKSPTSVAAGVQEVVTGYDHRLIADFASHSPGVDLICENILADTYSLSVEPAMPQRAVAPRQSLPTASKLQALDIVDFRGIRCLRSEDMPLSGDIVFIYGPNGVGKTSIADAVEWVITGKISRIESQSQTSGRNALDPIVNVFSENGEAHVTCHLNDSRASVSRTKRGLETTRMIGNSITSDDRDVIDHVVGTKAPSQETSLQIPRLRDLFRGSHMLAQHNIRQFLEKGKSAERFDILTNMIGAEEFVRFRNKVGAVLGKLRSNAKTVAESCRNWEREMEDICKRRQERQKEFEKLGHLVTTGRTPKDVASELLQGLKSCQCKIDEDAIERAGNESSEQQLELVSVLAETAISVKKADIEGLLLRVNSLEQEFPGYHESQQKCQRLTTTISTAKEISENTNSEIQEQEAAIQEIQTRLDVSRTEQTKAAKRCADATWLRDKLPAYRVLQQSIKRSENVRAEQREAFQEAEAVHEGLQKALAAKQVRLEEIKAKVAVQVDREQAIAGILTRLENAKDCQQSAERLATLEKKSHLLLEDLTRQASTVRDELNTAQSRLAELQRAYDSEAARHDLLSSFQARLAEMVHSSECPLCGTAFATIKKAEDTIREHLSAVPSQLSDLAHQLNVVKTDLETKQARADSLAAKIQILETETQQVCSNRAKATQIVNGFLADCNVLGIPILEHDVSSWGNSLGQALKDNDVSSLRSEATSLGGETQALNTRIEEQRSKNDEARQEIAQQTKLRNRLVAEAQGIEVDLARREIDPGALPTNDDLDIRVHQQQNEARRLDQLVAKEEAELDSKESLIKSLRKDLKRIDEDVAHNESLLRKHEAACNDFVAACHALKIDPDNVTESCDSARNNASELNENVSKLAQMQQVLQQVASLGRLELEVDRLKQSEGHAKRKAEQSSHEKEQLQDWVSRIANLEKEVLKGQGDAVGAHLRRLEPTTQGLYHRLNPHPIFGNVKMRVDDAKGELDVEAQASLIHERLDGAVVPPSAFFSDAQMNSLAISVFLAGALRQRWSQFNTILIDDPVQQMDEMNVCSFLDLIRGLSTQRQFIVFTCSRDFYLLALDKLTCLNKLNPGSFLAYRLEGIAPAELKVHCDAQ